MMSAENTVREPAAPNGLRQLAVGRSREDTAPVLELVDVAQRLRGEDLDRVLVTEVVGALTVSKACFSGLSSAALPSAALMPFGRPGVAARRMQLRDDGNVCAGVVSLDSRPHAGETGPDDEDVVLRFHCPDPIENDGSPPRTPLHRAIG